MKELIERMTLRRRGYLAEAKATGKVLSRLPSGTEVVDSSGLSFSFWDGKVALVTTSNFGDSDPRDWFDPELMARKYWVRFVMDGRTPFKAEKFFLRQQPVVANPSAPYEKTSFTLYGGMGRPKIVGGFGPHHEYWVKLKPKDLSPGERRMVLRRVYDMGYVDASYYKLTPADWKKAFAMRSYAEVQEKFGHDKANAFEEMLKRANNHRYPDEDKEELVWRSIRGVYSETKNGKIKFIISR